MLAQTILKDTLNATSSPESASGVTHCDELNGQMIDLFGQVVARANHSAPQAPKKARPMIVTSGQFGLISSASADLELSLVNKLKQRLTTDGSILFNLIWKEKTTPAGRSVYRLRASGRRISDNDCGSWRTPAAFDPIGGVKDIMELIRNKAPSPQLKLRDQAPLASWPTPQTMDTLPPMDYEKRLNHPGRPGRTVSGNLREVVTLASWPSPMALSGGPSKNPNNPRGINAGNPLETAAVLASWLTTSTRDYKGGYQGGRMRNGKISTDTLDVAAQLAFGPNVIGSTAATEKIGQLNPAHSRWLMGLPPEWDAYAPTATPSSRKLRKPL